MLPNYQATTINAELVRNLEPDTKVLTDAYGSLSKALKGFEHVAINTKRSGTKAHHPYPAVPRVQAQLKRWLHGTHQGAVSREHMTEYLWEFEFRFNRRHARKPGLLFYRLPRPARRGASLAAGCAMRSEGHGQDGQEAQEAHHRPDQHREREPLPPQR